ncbi:MAG TPA: hypothetical protein VGK88_04865 [bacterium]
MGGLRRETEPVEKQVQRRTEVGPAAVTQHADTGFVAGRKHPPVAVLNLRYEVELQSGSRLGGDFRLDPKRHPAMLAGWAALAAGERSPPATRIDEKPCGDVPGRRVDDAAGAPEHRRAAELGAGLREGRLAELAVVERAERLGQRPYRLRSRSVDGDLVMHLPHACLRAHRTHNLQRRAAGGGDPVADRSFVEKQHGWASGIGCRALRWSDSLGDGEAGETGAGDDDVGTS